MQSKTFEEVFSLAEQGDAMHQTELGLRYYHGNGVEQDYQEAVKWLTSAAFQWMCFRYDGEEYISCADKAQDRMDYDGSRWVVTEPEDDCEYIGDDWAAYWLGECYLHGYGVEQDVAKALGIWEFSAEQGGQGVMMELANHYANTASDFAKAAYWWGRAAEIGFPEARYQLARCYHEGIGVEKDDARALSCLQHALDDFYGVDYSSEDDEWYVKIGRLAIELGDEEAKDVLAELGR